MMTSPTFWMSLAFCVCTGEVLVCTGEGTGKQKEHSRWKEKKFGLKDVSVSQFSDEDCLNKKQ